MSGIPIGGLPSGTPNDTDLFIVSTASQEDRKLTRAQVVAGIKAQIDAHEGEANPHADSLDKNNNLSDLADVGAARQNLGLIQTERWFLNTGLGTGTEQGGIWIPPVALTIIEVRIYLKTIGGSGITRVDIHKNGTTIFTTQANRPTINQPAGPNPPTTPAVPDITALAAGDLIRVDVDNADDGADELTVEIIYR